MTHSPLRLRDKANIYRMNMKRKWKELRYKRQKHWMSVTCEQFQNNCKIPDQDHTHISQMLRKKKTKAFLSTQMSIKSGIVSSEFTVEFICVTKTLQNSNAPTSELRHFLCCLVSDGQRENVRHFWFRWPPGRLHVAFTLCMQRSGRSMCTSESPTTAQLTNAGTGTSC